MTMLRDRVNDFLAGHEVGLDMYGLSGHVDISESDDGLILVVLEIYPQYLNFFTEEELDTVDISKLEAYYDVDDGGAEWETSTLSVYEEFNPNVSLDDALGTLFDKAEPLIYDLTTGRFDEVVKGAMNT